LVWEVLVTKLMSLDRYNVNGLKELYLLAYVSVADFSDFINTYEIFLKDEALYPSELLLQYLVTVNQTTTSIHVWRAIHENDTIVYHICTRIPQN